MRSGRGCRGRFGRPGTPLSEVVASWPGSPAALAAYMSRIEVTHGVAAGNLAAAAVTDVTGGAWVGLMEGALRSGARAASEVLARACP